MQSIFLLRLLWESSICCWVMVSSQWTNFTLIYDRPWTRVSNNAIKFNIKKSPVVQMKQKMKSLASMHSISNTAESYLIHLQRWTKWQEKSNELHDQCIGLDFVHSWLTRPGTLQRRNRDFKILTNHIFVNIDPQLSRSIIYESSYHHLQAFS